MSEEDKETVAYHEAGHAVVSFNLIHTDPVQKITIVPRGRAGGRCDAAAGGPICAQPRIFPWIRLPWL
ncbi:MAG: hypothetical protein IPJ94_24840 [Chloroflexi bacterium]|nr:hypothetical protein [Chloroflexota bacterium]